MQQGHLRQRAQRSGAQVGGAQHRGACSAYLCMEGNGAH